jgi:cellulose synthase/poly-beta-1,6-N-acetylglucosamine synthase-like glycosyltransferase
VSLGVNGACIIAKREVIEKVGGFERVITEDSDFGCRASEAGFKPVFARDAVVETSAPKSYSSWYRQRARWAVGEMQTAALRREHHMKHALESFAQSLVVFPWWFPFILSIISPGSLVAKIVYLLSGAFSTKSKYLPQLAAASFIWLAITQPLLTVLNLAILTAWIYVWARTIDFPGIRPEDILWYYFVYAPMWGALLLGALVYVAVKGTDIKEFMGWRA